MRYIEQNPVRAGLVEHAERYPWSSFGANALGTWDPLVSAHHVYRELGSSQAGRRSRYRALFEQPVAESEIDAIRDATQNAWALGDAPFCRAVDVLGRRAERTRVGRRARPGPGLGNIESGVSPQPAKLESDPNIRGG
jgi:putative transposase